MSEPPATDVATLLTNGTVAGTWALDPAGSRAEFRVKHFWVPSPSAAPSSA
jgi:polyisoprenoid-binding protein YceI